MRLIFLNQNSWLNTHARKKTHLWWETGKAKFGKPRALGSSNLIRVPVLSMCNLFFISYVSRKGWFSRVKTENDRDMHLVYRFPATILFFKTTHNQVGRMNIPKPKVLSGEIRKIIESEHPCRHKQLLPGGCGPGFDVRVISGDNILCNQTARAQTEMRSPRAWSWDRSLRAIFFIH